jgi:polyhydroxyalkanoate synthase
MRQAASRGPTEFAARSRGVNKDTADRTGTTAESEQAAWASIAERSRRIVSDFLESTAQGEAQGFAESVRIGVAFMEALGRLWSDPMRMMQAQMSLWQDYARLWGQAAERMAGRKPEPVATHEPSDRRFRHAHWEENHLFNFLKQSYLLTSRWMHGVMRDVEGLDDKTAKKVEFYTRQWIDAVSPTNFLLTNPEALQATVETRGENLLKGLENLLADLERGRGQLNVKTIDVEHFEVGKNLAVTPGKVVFQNELMQLIQYAPSTEKVRRRPVVIFPPWINKYYILDLRPENSFVKWAVDQGLTVFIVSWVNPDERLARKTFEDYMFEGPLAALDAVRKATGERTVTAVGYCIGGTLLAATLAYMAAKGDDRIVAATFLTSLVDFSAPGDLEVFIDDAQLKELESKMSERGYLKGSEMAATFNLLRANDLIWNYVVNNYLLGKEPFPFDILYWNGDSTRMPAAMHSFYLRKMYVENKLIEPGGITLGSVPIDVREIRVPVDLVSAREDHIAPWKTTYTATQLYAGPTRFVLSLSGHVAGVVNPPAANRYGYWTNDATPPDPEEWLRGTTRHEGSWWPDWEAWNRRHAGPLVPARDPAKGGLAPIEDAPGSYVRVNAR